MADPSEQTVSFDTSDGTRLEGTLVEPAGDSRASLLIGPGTGIPRRFYSRFARHAAGRGLAVLTVDYRGIGGSAPKTLRGYEARYRDIGHQDLPAAIGWLGDRFADRPLLYVGHSAGGQQVGLAPNVGRIQAAVFVAVSTGYTRGMPLRQRLLTWSMLQALPPIAARTLGYLPASALGLGEDLPIGMAREWGAWCSEPTYLAAFFDETGHRRSPDGAPFGPVHFADATFPIRAFAFTDDPIATRQTVRPMLAQYKNADIDLTWVAPSDLGVPAIGHLGFFRSDVGAPLWDQALDRLAPSA